MARIRFAIGTRYVRGGHLFQVRSSLPNDCFEVENSSFGSLHTVTYSELIECWQRGELQFELKGGGSQAKKGPVGLSATQYTITDFQSLSSTIRAEAWRRYNLLLPLMRLPPEQLTRQRFQSLARELQMDLDKQLMGVEGELAQRRRAAGKRAPVGQAVSYSSLEKWLRNFRQSGYDIRALVPRTDRAGGKGVKRLDPYLEQLLESVFEECAKEMHYRTVEDVFAMLANAIAEQNRTLSIENRLKLPAQSTVYRRIKEKRLERLLRRQPSIIENQANQSVGKGPEPNRPLQRVEIDHTCLDLLVVDEEDRLPIGRPTLTFALDVYTGFPFGCYVGFEPPSYHTVQLCLLHGILPKPDCQNLYGTTNSWSVYGLPEVLVVDNGKEFRGQDLSDACAQLGIELQPTPVRKPWFKGSIERYFRTLNTGLIHPLPGTTFSNILERGDYNPATQACISLASFRQLLHIFILDVYAQRWHSGLEATPVKRWQESVLAGFKPALAHSAQEVRILLLRTAERTVQRTGIDFEALRYQCPELARVRSQPNNGEKVRIKYDPADLSALYVSDPAAPQGWLRVPAVDQDYTAGLSLWKHRIIREYVLREKREVNIYELAAAKQLIQQLAAAEFKMTRQQRGRKTAARWLGIGTELTGPAPDAQLPQPAPNSSTDLPETEKNSEILRTFPANPVVASQLPSAEPEPEQATNTSKNRLTVIGETQKEEEEEEFLRGPRWGGDYNLPRLRPLEPARPEN